MWLSWITDGRLRGFDSARNSGLSNTTNSSSHSATTRMEGLMSSKPASRIRYHETEEEYPET